MEIHLTSEQAAQLTQLAIYEGRGVEELTREALGRYLSEQARYIAGVLEAEAAVERGEILSSEQVGTLLAHFLTV